MKGTEKQVKWAESIQAKLIAKARESYDAYKDYCTISPVEVMRYFESAAQKLVEMHDHASWWIDRRNGSVLDDIDEIVNALYAENQQ